MPTRLFRQGPQLRGGACPPPNRRTGRWDRACLQDSLRSFPLSREVPQLTLGGCPVQRAVGGRACATQTDQQTRPPATCHDPETSQSAREAFPLLRIGFGRPEETMGGPTVGSYSLGPHVSIGGIEAHSYTPLSDVPARLNTSTFTRVGNPFPFRLNPPRRSAALLRAQQGVVHLVAEQLWAPQVGRAPANAPSREFH